MLSMHLGLLRAFTHISPSNITNQNPNAILRTNLAWLQRRNDSAPSARNNIPEANVLPPYVPKNDFSASSLSLASFLPSSYISRIRVVSRSSRPMCTFRLGLKTKISPDSSSDSIKSSVSLYRLYRVSMHSTYAGYLRYIHLKNGGISRFFRYPATWVTTTTVRVYPRLRKNDTGILSDVPPSRSL